jgi:hypothetical protein
MGERPTVGRVPVVSRRQVLLGGAVGAGTLFVRPSRASATVGERIHRDVPSS